MQSDRSGALKKQEERKQEIKSLQDHHNSNNQQQSTDNQPSQDLLQQIQLKLTITRPPTTDTPKINYSRPFLYKINNNGTT